VLKLSRKEEDFDHLSMFRWFFNETEIGKLLKKWDIFNEEELRALCLEEELSGRYRYEPLSLEGAFLVAYSIESGIITFDEYVDSYQGSLSDFCNFFLLQLRGKELDYIRSLVERDPELRGEPCIEVFLVLPESYLVVISCYGRELSKEDITSFCYDSIYGGTDPFENYSYILGGSSRLTNAEIIIFFIESGLVNPKDLVPEPRFLLDTLGFLDYIRGLIGHPTFYEYFNKLGHEYGIYKLIKDNKEEIIQHIIESGSQVDAELLLESGLLTEEDIEYFYKQILMNEKSLPILSMVVGRYLDADIIEETSNEVFGLDENE